MQTMIAGTADSWKTVPHNGNGFFCLVLVIVPILMLGGAELILRWLDYGGNLDLVVANPSSGMERTEISRKQERTFSPRCKSIQRMRTQEGCSLESYNRDDHELYYDLIKEFENETGCPVIINISFNVRGEPIVGFPKTRSSALCEPTWIISS